MDRAGNTFTETKNVDGIVDDVWDAFRNLAGTIVDLSDWIWEKVTGAASVTADAAVDLAS